MLPKDQCVRADNKTALNIDMRFSGRLAGGGGGGGGGGHNGKRWASADDDSDSDGRDDDCNRFTMSST